MLNGKIKLGEKIGYALGDGAANIAWRGVSTFLFIFYTDVFGLTPASVGLLFLIARGGDGFVDIAMGIIGDKTESRYGKFRPWILWTALPLGIILSLLFVAPDLSNTGKIIYAYTTYLLFMVIYTANNIPYGALMAVMTLDDKERTTIGSYRMVGAFAGGMVVQGALLYLVMLFGNVNPTINVSKLDNEKYEVTVSSSIDVANANIKTKNGIGQFVTPDEIAKADADSFSSVKIIVLKKGSVDKYLATGVSDLKKSDINVSNQNVDVEIQKLTNSKNSQVIFRAKQDVENVNVSVLNKNLYFKRIAEPTPYVSFKLKKDQKYSFIVTGEKDITTSSISLINQKKGYSHAIYLLSFFLAFFMLITFYTTKERVKPPKAQKSNLKQDLKQLFKNKPWLILLSIGVLFNLYNSIKQGIVVIYFSHYLHNSLLAASFMVGLTLASIFGAIATSPLNKKFGKKNLFVFALIFSGLINAMLAFCGPNDIGAIFTLGIISEFAAAIFPTLFFAMLGDAADYSEFKNKRRATGLIYSAGSFATKLGQGLAGAIIGMVLAIFSYNGQDIIAIQGAVPGIIMLMSWIPTIIALIAAGCMSFYPLNQNKMNEITLELNARRANELASQNENQ